MTTVYISNSSIQVLIGDSNGKKVTITKRFQTEAPVGCIINGMVTNEQDYVNHIKQLWEENNIPKKDVALAINSTHFITKIVDLPTVSDRKTVDFLKHELQDVVRVKEPMYTYLTLSEDKKTKMSKVLAIVIEKAFVTRHINLFAGLGIEISYFDAALSSAIKALQSMPAMKNDISVTHIMENSNMLNLLFVDGVYTFSNTTRLFSEHGTPGFGVEVARAVSTMQQFVKAQQLEKPLHSIYLAGTQEGDFEYCRECITQVNNDVEVAMLPNYGSIVMKGGAGDYTAFIVAIGCMMSAGGRSKLFPPFSGIIEQYKLDPKGDKNAQDLKKAIVPLCSLVGVGVLVSVGLGVMCGINQVHVKTLTNFLNTKEVSDTTKEYENIVAMNAELAKTENDVDNVWKYIDSYPTYNTEVEDVIKRCAEGLADVQITSFKADSGLIEVKTTAENVDLIHLYVAALKKEPIFYDVDYVGYSYGGDNVGWTVKVECTLADIAGKSVSNVYSETGLENLKDKTEGTINKDKDNDEENEDVEQDTEAKEAE
jgi:Tfp pilus assembly PilM family ATPase